jgi:GNAT superfamily N-acetyltransferase
VQLVVGMGERFEIRSGTVEDCQFLGVAIRDAERAHSNRGLWDILIENNEIISEVLSKSCLAPGSVYFYPRFLIVWDLENNKPVSSACRYCSPELGIGQTIPIILEILKRDYQWTDEEITKALDRLSILDGSFPTNVNWDDGNTWMIEAVYTNPEYRRQGLGKLIVQAAISEDEAKNHHCHRCWITCSLGNEAAYHLYQSVGFQLIGDAATIQSNSELKFHVLEIVFA